MNLILQPLRSFGLTILLMAASSVAFSATITSNGTGGGNWSAGAWADANRTGNITTSIVSTAVTGVGTFFTTELSIGSVIKTVGGVPIGTVASITDDANLTLAGNALSTNSNITFRFQGVGPGDDVRILGGDHITVDVASAACKTLAGVNSGSGAWSLAFNAGSQLTVTGVATIGDPTDAGSVDMTSGGLLKVGSLAAGAGGATLTPGTGTVEFTGTSTIPTQFPNFNNITVSGAAVLTASQGLNISGNVTTTAGATLHAGDFTHFIGGNLTNAGTFEGGTQGGTGTIYLNGSVDQTISNTNAAATNHTVNVTINKPAGSVILNTDFTVVNTLNMVKGNIILNTHNLILGIDGGGNVGVLTHTDGTIVGSGKFIRWFTGAAEGPLAAAGLFPVGTASVYRPLYISIPTGVAAGTVAVEYHDADGTTQVSPSIPDGGATDIAARKNFSWEISDPTAPPLNLNPVDYPALGSGSFNITAVGTNPGAVTDVADLRLMLANSVVGSEGTNGGTTTIPQVNRTLTTSAQLFNTFFIGSIDPSSTALPITLLSFTASPVNGSVRLDWETTSEINNDHFTIQRSRNSVDWESIKVVPGAVNSSVNVKYSEYDESPYQGVSYYRLQQTDRDGKTSFSPIVSVKIGQSASINVYPNPTADHIWITTVGSGRLNVVLYNNNGRRINVPLSVNGNSARLDVGTLSAGTYFVHILQGGQSESRVVLIAK